MNRFAPLICPSAGREGEIFFFILKYVQFYARKKAAPLNEELFAI